MSIVEKLIAAHFSNILPTEVGFYWLYDLKIKKLRVIKIWKYSDSSYTNNYNELYTNEDGGTNLKEYVSSDNYWMRIEEPEIPTC